MSYRTHENCRACSWGPPQGPGGIKSASTDDHLESVLNLGVMPLPNAFRRNGESCPGHYPIDLVVCPRCTLGQLSVVVDPLVLYDQYPYVTSSSQTMRDHFDNLWLALNFEQKIGSVVEIGSNDGLCLEYFKSLGAETVIGIDPAQNLNKVARKRGINSLCSLFDRQSAEMARAAMPPIDLVLARHVFCHVDNWQEFINNIGVLCSKDTLVCIEVPYAQDMIDSCEWDTVYAEHTSYLTVKAIQYLLDGSALKLQGIARFPVHGGVIGLLLRRRDSDKPRSGTVQQFLEGEHCAMADWKRFAAKAWSQISELRDLVRTLRQQGKTVVGYGASAKSTVWANACRFTKKDIAFITDNTVAKQYTKSPGTDIPIVDEGALTRELPEYAICFAWNYFSEIYEKEKIFRDKGGRWIVPTPKVRVV